MGGVTLARASSDGLSEERIGTALTEIDQLGLPRPHVVTKVDAACTAAADAAESYAVVTIGLGTSRARLAIGETVILLHPPLPLVCVSIVMERERQQNDSLVNG